jgi:uncharacterized protein GlcG (DUF336 family)
MIDAGMAEARKQGLRMAVAIVDSGGNLVAFGRMDDVMLASIQISMDKAYTAVKGKLPTQVWRDILQSGAIPPLFFHERWTAFPGGFPLIKGNQIFGGMGASGGTGFGDTSVVRAGLQAGEFSTEDADAMLKDEKE